MALSYINRTRQEAADDAARSAAAANMPARILVRRYRRELLPRESELLYL